MTVRTRFAPSPTGYLHIGGVRTALFNWLFSRQRGGQFLLRIDDTDQERNVEAALQPILDGFRWLGIDWDEGPEVGGPYAPYFQSQRSSHYQAAVQELLNRGFAYRDYARTEELQQEREAAEREKRPFVYSRRFMARNDADIRRFEQEGRTGVVRLLMHREGVCRFHDLVRGPVEFEWAAEQDHVIQRANGSCLYHLASVVDDRDFQISHVIRAEEHLSNTPRQIFIAQGLGCDVPQFAHLPYVAEPGSKNKLSKRKIAQYLKNADFKKLYDHGHEIAKRIGVTPTAETFNPVLVEFYKEVGYLPDAILNYLVLLGWSLDDKTEFFTRQQMIEHFSLERVHRAPASFDPQKLWSFQDQHMRTISPKSKIAMVLPYLQRAGLVSSPPPCSIGPKLSTILQAAGDRIKTSGDILEFNEFFETDDQFTYDEKAFEKRILQSEQAVPLLRLLRNRVLTIEPYDAPSLEGFVKAFVEEQGIKIGDIIHALRVALTGKSVGLGMFETMAILGRESCAARIDRTVAKSAK